jgi:cell division protein FtsZ
VVGTVIDESMGDDLRVTLVATGIGEENVMRSQTNPEPSPAVTDISINRTPSEAVPLAATGTNDSAGEIDNGRYDEALLDVPAFLRRQAD